MLLIKQKGGSICLSMSSLESSKSGTFLLSSDDGLNSLDLGFSWRKGFHQKTSQCVCVRVTQKCAKVRIYSLRHRAEFYVNLFYQNLSEFM